jgi:hypothetical protein
LPPQPLNAEIVRHVVAADDRAGIAQPDVAERLDDDRAAWPTCVLGGLRGFLVGGDEDHLLARPPAWTADEGGDFGARGLEVREPQFGMAGKADPDGVVRRPFGGGGGESCGGH